MQPDATRGIGGGQLVAGKVLNFDVEGRGRPRFCGYRADRGVRIVCVRIRGAVVGGLQHFGLCGDVELLAVVAEHLLHQKVAADEDVAVHAVALRSVESGDGDGFGDLRHVAFLAGLFACGSRCVPTQGRAFVQEAGRWVCRRVRGQRCKGCGNCRIGRRRVCAQRVAERSPQSTSA